MIEEHVEHFEGQCADMRSSASSLRDMQRGAEGRREHLRLEPVDRIDLDNLLDEVHAILSDIIETADKRADDVGACLGGQQSLSGREAKRDVEADAFLTQQRGCLDAIAGKRN